METLTTRYIFLLKRHTSTLRDRDNPQTKRERYHRDNCRRYKVRPVKIDIPAGNYVVLAQNGHADADGLGASSTRYCTAGPTSATIMAEY